MLHFTHYIHSICCNLLCDYSNESTRSEIWFDFWRHNEFFWVDGGYSRTTILLSRIWHEIKNRNPRKSIEYFLIKFFLLKISVQIQPFGFCSNSSNRFFWNFFDIIQHFYRLNIYYQNCYFDCWKLKFIKNQKYLNQ
jgi:hypothetical protein